MAFEFLSYPALDLWRLDATPRRRLKAACARSIRTREPLRRRVTHSADLKLGVTGRKNGAVMRRAFFFALAVLPIACASTSGADRPEWVNRPRAYDDNDRILYAVGAKKGIKNPVLLKTAADNQARAAMTAILNTYSASLMKDYMSSTSASAEPGATSEEQLVESVVKTFSNGYLSGVEIVENWRDPNDGTLYSLARLDLSNFSEALSKAEALSDRLRERVRRSADRAFADLDREIEKQD